MTPRTIILLLALTAFLTACQELPPIKLRLVNVADPDLVEAYAPLRFPGEGELGEDLDIVVRQTPGGAIVLTNREPREFENMRLWINRQYVTQVERIHIGDHPDNRIPLNRFVNRFGEPFPVGTFLAPEKSDHVLIAEMVPLDEQPLRHRLAVRRGDYLRAFAGGLQ